MGTAVLRVLGVVLLATALLVLVDPRDPNLVFDRRLVLAGVALAAMAATAAVAIGRRSRRTLSARWRSWAVALIVPVLGGGLSAYLGRQLAYAYGWDAAVVDRISQNLTRAGGRLTPYEVGYLSRYPFNVGLVGVDNAARDVAARLGTTMQLVYVCLNALSVAVTVVCVYAIVRMVRSHRAGLCAELVLFLLVGLSPWMAVPYTDLTVVPFVALGLLLATLAFRSGPRARMALLGALSLAVLSAGYVVKSTTAAAVGGVVVLAVLVALGRPRPRSILAALAVVVVATSVFLGTSALARAAIDRPARVDVARLDPGAQRPLTWFIAMGLMTVRMSDGRMRYGAYDSEFNAATGPYTGAALQDLSSRMLRDRLEQLGPAGLTGFLLDKQAFNWGDGMFWAWGEGSDAVPSNLRQHTPSARAVQSWNHRFGAYYLGRASLTDGVWLFVLLWSGLGLLGATYRREVALLALAVVGITVFTLLVQSRSKYLLPYVPVVVALAALVDPRVLVLRWQARHVRSATT